MHPDELDIDDGLVRRLLQLQFPECAHLSIERMPSPGTVNAMFRLGHDMLVRAPFVPMGGAGIELEARWLPRLAPQLPVAIPAVLGVGAPALGYPCPWLLLNWLPGACPVPGRLEDPKGLAHDIAAFLVAMREVDTADAPRGYRGGSLSALDEPVRACLAECRDLFPQLDIRALAESWRDSLAASAWPGSPVWVHCDLLPGNVLVENGRLVGVLDFAASGVGDPACDLMAAWSMLPTSGRRMLRDLLDVDDATWSRGRGWALAQAVIALPYYRESNPAMAASALHVLTELVT
jgi:aminoglycoside phosphotransferase (APT) family kinase protein